MKKFLWMCGGETPTFISANDIDDAYDIAIKYRVDECTQTMEEAVLWFRENDTIVDVTEAETIERKVKVAVETGDVKEGTLCEIWADNMVREYDRCYSEKDLKEANEGFDKQYAINLANRHPHVKFTIYDLGMSWEGGDIDKVTKAGDDAVSWFEDITGMPCEDCEAEPPCSRDGIWVGGADILGG